MCLDISVCVYWEYISFVNILLNRLFIILVGGTNEQEVVMKALKTSLEGVGSVRASYVLGYSNLEFFANLSMITLNC